MSDSAWAAVAAITMAAINTIGSVLHAWIKARYPSVTVDPKDVRHNGANGNAKDQRTA